MNIKDDLQFLVQKELGTVASPFLLNRAVYILQTASGDKTGLMQAAEKIGSLIGLFIDKTLGERTKTILTQKIDERS